MGAMLGRFATVAIGGALFAAVPTGPYGTLRQQVRRAKPELAGHANLPDYHESPFQPSEIVERIHGLESKQAWSELCRELGALPDEELELFEDAIRKPEHAK